MKIVQLTPGAGGDFYCENCIRDGALVRAVRSANHDMLLTPLYLPLRVEQQVSGAESDLFFGGVNVYLQQRFKLFRHTPRWVDRIFDSRRLLRRVARRAKMTDSHVLGETTLSMLRGERGRQVKELNRLIEWLNHNHEPDVIVLSNVLLAGLVREMKRRLGCAVVCLLQDETQFLDGLEEPYRQQVWEVLRDRAAEIDEFVAVSHFYADEMTQRLSLDADRVSVVHTGLDATPYAPAPQHPETPVIGYLSQITPAKGLSVLAEAFIRLKHDPRRQSLRLRIAGGYTEADKGYLQKVRDSLRSAGVLCDTEFVHVPDRQSKIRFIQSLSVMSVPSIHQDAYGLFALESLACGVPLVLPGHGAFPEIMNRTGGGLLCEPENPEDLARKIESLLSEPNLAKQYGRTGRRAVEEKFTIDRMARGVISVLNRAAKERRK